MKWFRPVATLLTFMFVSTLSATAQTGSFVVGLRNGESVEFRLSERPKLTFPDGKLIISTAEVRSEFELNEILKTGFNGVTGVESVKADDGKTVVFDLESVGGHVLISGCKLASVYDLAGKLVLTVRQTESGQIDVDMTNFQQGVYVVHTPVRSIKYMKP